MKYIAVSVSIGDLVVRIAVVCLARCIGWAQQSEGYSSQSAYRHSLWFVASACAVVRVYEAKCKAMLWLLIRVVLLKVYLPRCIWAMLQGIHEVFHDLLLNM